MQTIAAQLEAEINRATPLLLGMTGVANQTSAPNQWSKKQILGHLLDSASNNHQRFVRTSQTSPLSFPDYNQEFWVQIQNYQAANWADMVELWRFYNKHLAFFIQHIPPAALQNQCIVGAGEPVTLEWLITDYLQHLRHHLADLLRPQTKSELLQQMAQVRTAFEQSLSQLSEAQLTRADAQSGWAIKDHLTHLAAWELGIAALLQRQSRWEAMGLDQATVLSHEMDDLNEIMYRQNKDRSLAEVMAYFHDAHQQMLAVLGILSNEDLFKTYSFYQPDEPGEDSGRPILDWVIGNTYEHYDEHQTWIEALLEQGK